MITIKYKDLEIFLEEDIINTISKYRQVRGTDYESGGMLIGSVTEDHKQLTINDLTIPIEGDFSSRVQYIRCTEHNEILKEKWASSGNTKMYFGEWHTHPQDNPFYSSQDFKNWEMLLTSVETYIENLFFLIAGRECFNIWIGNRINGKITSLFKGEYSQSAKSI